METLKMIVKYELYTWGFDKYVMSTNLILVCQGMTEMLQQKWQSQ